MSMTDPRLASPGDPGIDCHLTGVRIAEVVVVRDTGEWDAEVTLTFATGGASGFWRDMDGGIFCPDVVTSLEAAGRPGELVAMPRTGAMEAGS